MIQGTVRLVGRLRRRGAGTPIQATVAGVVAGRYPEGAIVTVTGTANGFAHHTTKQGNTWATFTLISPATAADATLFPLAYKKFGDGMGPTLNDYRPQDLTVIGRVMKRGWRPSLLVLDVQRLTDERCESLEKMRRQSVRADAVLSDLRKQGAFDEQ